MIHATYHGHSFWELIFDEKSIFIDPFIEWNPLCDITLQEACWKNIHAIVLSHGHSDHTWVTAKILQNNPETLLIATFELCSYFKTKYGYSRIAPMSVGGQQHFDGYAIKLTQALHWGAIEDSGLSCPPTGIVVSIGNKHIYHAWDTALFWDMSYIGKVWLDLAILPIWDVYTMWISDAVEATRLLSPKTVVPMHYNTFENIKVDPIEFARLVMLENLSVPKVLKPWQSIVL